jgi:hypothetical protein
MPKSSPSRLDLVIALLHASGDAALATHSTALPGHPFASHLPFAADEHQRPVFLMSQLAEHTQNIIADPRASLLVKETAEGAEAARATLVGKVLPVKADPLLVARYLRYHPAAEQFLQLGDFGFHRLDVQRIRVVGGFGMAAWLEGSRLLDAPSLTLREEAELLPVLEKELPADWTPLGVDAYGLDCLADGRRLRIGFDPGPLPADAVPAALGRAMANFSKDATEDPRHGS